MQQKNASPGYAEEDGPGALSFFKGHLSVACAEEISIYCADHPEAEERDDGAHLRHRCEHLRE